MQPDSEEVVRGKGRGVEYKRVLPLSRIDKESEAMLAAWLNTAAR